MANRRFEVFELRQILVRMRLGESDRDLSKSGLIGRKKAGEIRRMALDRGWLNAGSPMPTDDEIAGIKASKSRKTKGSQVLPFADFVSKWSANGITGTAIFSKLKRDHDFTGSYESVKRFLAALPRPPKTTMILTFKVAEAAQVDFGSGPMLLDPVSGRVRKSWVFVMTLCFSRHQYIEFVFDQKIETWLKCHRHAFEAFGGVPGKILIDNLKSGITNACYHDPLAQRSYADYAEGYGFIIAACPPHDPKKKGIVESGVKFVKRGFIPLREFRDIHDANRQAREWCVGEAGNRIHGTTRQRPLTHFIEAERAFLKPLPDLPPELAIWTKASLHPDCHIMFEYCRYSAPHALVGKDLWLRVTITMVEIYHEHSLVASHPRTATPGKPSTVPDHLPPNAVAFLMKTPQWCMEQARRVGPYCGQLIKDLLTDRVMERLRGAQGILGLSEKFGSSRLEAACHRAFDHGVRTRKGILRILEHGLDVDYAAETRPAEVSKLYAGNSVYCRDSKTLMN